MYYKILKVDVYHFDLNIFINILKRITNLFSFKASKNLVLVKSRVQKYRPGLNIIEHQ